MIRSFALGLLTIACLATPAAALTVPFTENFSTNNSNWGLASSPSSTYISAPYVATGGPNGVGDGYITSLHTLGSSTQGQVIFRGQNGFDSSGDAFVGNWLTAGITQLRFFVRHNAEIDLTIGARFGVSNNSPAASVLNLDKVSPNVWTEVRIPITNAVTPGISYNQEGGTFAGVFGALGNLQILAQRETLATGTQVQFDVDRISIVPEPSSVVLAGLGLGALALAAWKRRRLAG